MCHPRAYEALIKEEEDLVEVLSLIFTLRWASTFTIWGSASTYDVDNAGMSLSPTEHCEGHTSAIGL